MFPSQFANIFLTYQTFFTNLHLLRVELRCKLQEKLHRVTGPSVTFAPSGYAVCLRKSVTVTNNDNKIILIEIQLNESMEEEVGNVD